MRIPPLAFFAGAYVAGIIIADQLRLGDPMALAAGAAGLLLLSLCIIAVAQKSRRWRFQEVSADSVDFSPLEPDVPVKIGGAWRGRAYWVCPAFFAAGLVLTTFTIASLERGLLVDLAVEDRPVRAEGVALGWPKKKEGRTSFFMRVERVTLSDTDDTWTTREFTRVVAAPDKNLSLRPGDHIAISGRLHVAAGDFPAYRHYLYRHRVLTSMFVGAADIQVDAARWRVGSAVQKCRDRLREMALQHLPEAEAGLLIGILIGDTTSITPEVTEDFKATGLSHLLAVSGQNVAFIAVSLLLFLRYLRTPPLGQFLICSLGIAGYTLLTLSEPSVLRAAVMSLVAVGAWLLGREYDLIASISAAALILLIGNPFLLFDVSFQLSFSATLAIVWLSPIIKARIGIAPEPLKNLIAISLAAQAGATPFIIFYFKRLSLVALPANLMVTPLMGLLMVIGMVAIAASFLATPLARAFLLLLLPFLKYAVWVAGFLADIPGSAMWTPNTAASLVFIALAAVTLVVLWSRLIAGKRGAKNEEEALELEARKPKISPFGIFCLLLVLAGSATWWEVGGTLFSSEVRVVFFDVGQGDSTLVRTAGRVTVLIDGGRYPDRLRQRLRERRVRKVDLLILTHAHADHLGGLTEIVEDYRIGTVIDSGWPSESLEYREFMKAVRRRRLQHARGKAGQIILVGPLEITVVNPPSPMLNATENDINNNSLVTKTEFKDFSLLVGGDVEMEGQKLILERGVDLASEVLLVPHHASATSDYQPFLEAVGPDIAVISVGRNVYGHPSKLVLEKLNKLEARILRTDKAGDIEIWTDGHSIRVYEDRL